jgi:hypothetical protein
MIRHRWNALALLLALSAGAHARADEASTSRYQAPAFNTPVGVGSLLGRADDQNQYALVIEGQNHFKQRRGPYGIRQYGHGESRLELGNGVGLSLSATSGVSLYGLKPGETWSPHVGIEALSGRITVNTNGSFERYYEWLPMMSAGLQFAVTRSCRLLPLARAGGGAGNLGKNGWAPSLRAAYGTGAYLNCADLDVAAEITRLPGSGNDVNLTTVDVAYPLSRHGLKIGLRGESTLERDGGSVNPDRTEQRVLVLLRGELTRFD